MSENLQSFVKGASMLRNVVNRVPADQWDSASCCEGWSARQVAGHITWGLETVASFAEGGGMAAEMPEADRAGSDPAATVSAAVDTAIAALDQPRALQNDTPMGMPLDGFLTLMSVDTMTHAWDIADATGIEHGIDDASAAAAQQAIAPMAEMMRAPGRFDDAVESSSDSAVDQFVAFTGRTSVR
ncbi:MAG: TIGR03086 family metal-binding protein [Ilumatobacter sp.]|uniref:TIGR03086 family metal-binding protein n=1 Tax=Ilumatobacter sp. TaxID=1967498 RepID=UPI003C771D1D